MVSSEPEVTLIRLNEPSPVILKLPPLAQPQSEMYEFAVMRPERFVELVRFTPGEFEDLHTEVYDALGGCLQICGRMPEGWAHRGFSVGSVGSAASSIS